MTSFSRSQPRIPASFSPAPSLSNNLYIYENELQLRENRLNSQSQQIDEEMQKLEQKILRQKQVQRDFQALENQLYDKQEKLDQITQKLTQTQQKLQLTEKQQAELLRSYQLQEQKFNENSIFLQLREKEIHDKERALSMAEYRLNQKENDTAELRNKLKIKTDLIDQERQNMLILEQRMNEIVRRAAQKEQECKIVELEAKRQIVNCEKQQQVLVGGVREIEGRKQVYEGLISQLENLKFQQQQEQKEQQEQQQVQQQYRQIYIPQENQLLTSLQAENKLLKSKIDSLEAHYQLLAESPVLQRQLKTELYDSERQKMSFEDQFSHNLRFTKQFLERQNSIENAVRIKENELSLLLGEADLIKKSLYRKNDRQKFFQELESPEVRIPVSLSQKSVEIPIKLSQGERKIQFASHDDELNSDFQDVSQKLNKGLNLQQTATRSFKTYDDLDMEELRRTGFSQVDDISLSQYVKNVGKQVQSACKRVEDLDDGKFKV